MNIKILSGWTSPVTREYKLYETWTVFNKDMPAMSYVVNTKESKAVGKYASKKEAEEAAKEANELNDKVKRIS